MNERPSQSGLLGTLDMQILLANIDAVPGPEVLISWRIDGRRTFVDLPF